MKNLNLVVLCLLLVVSACGQRNFNKKHSKNDIKQSAVFNKCENPNDYEYVDFDRISKGYNKEIIKINIKTIGQAPPFNPSNTDITFTAKFIENKNYKGFAYILFKDNKIGGIILKKDFVRKFLNEDFIIEKSPMSNCINENGGTWIAASGCLFDYIFYRKDWENEYGNIH